MFNEMRPGPLCHVCPVNCVGGWATCNVNCVEVYSHSVEAEGTGTVCDEVAGAERSCSGGQCPTPIDCAMSDWGTCSEPCGGGTQTRTKTPAQHGGQDCTGDTSLSQVCNVPDCPVNCVGSFSVCNSDCEYTWSVTQEQEGSGTACDYTPGHVASCSGGDCPVAVDCSFSDWGTCSESCGSGTQTRTKTEAQNGGTDCTGDVTVERSCNTHHSVPGRRMRHFIEQSS